MSMAGPVELGGQQPLGQRHAHRVGQPLAQRPGGGFHARRHPTSGWPGRARVQLPELLQFFQRQVVAGQYSTAYSSIEPWPLLSTKRSRLAQCGSAGL
jgi:hypothetical protein